MMFGNGLFRMFRKEDEAIGDPLRERTAAETAAAAEMEAEFEEIPAFSLDWTPRERKWKRLVTLVSFLYIQTICGYLLKRVEEIREEVAHAAFEKYKKAAGHTLPAVLKAAEKKKEKALTHVEQPSGLFTITETVLSRAKGDFRLEPRDCAHPKKAESQIRGTRKNGILFNWVTCMDCGRRLEVVRGAGSSGTSVSEAQANQEQEERLRNLRQVQERRPVIP